MAEYLGVWDAGSTLTFYVQTVDPDTGAVQIADAPPLYRVYDTITATPVATGSMVALDAGNTTGWYAGQLTLTPNTPWLAGHRYSIRIQATVDGIQGAAEDTFTFTVAGAFVVTPAQLKTQARAGVISGLTAPPGRMMVFRPHLSHPGFRRRPVLNPAHPLATGLVGWWRVHPTTFRQTTRWPDLSGKAPPALLANLSGTTEVSGWHAPTRQGSTGELRLDGINNQYVEVAGNLQIGHLASHTWSLACWAWIQTLTAYHQVLLTVLGDDTQALYIYYDTFLNTWAMQQSSGVATGDSGITPVPQTWTHLCMTGQGNGSQSVATLYINGVASATMTYGAGMADVSAIFLEIGRYWDPTYGMSNLWWGRIDDVFLYQRLLSRTEVATLYRSSLQGHPTLRRAPVRLLTLGGAGSQSVTVSPARLKTQAATPLGKRTVLVQRSAVAWRAVLAPHPVPVQPARVVWQATTTPIGPRLRIPPASLKLQAATGRLGRVLRVQSTRWKAISVPPAGAFLTGGIVRVTPARLRLQAVGLAAPVRLLVQATRMAWLVAIAPRRVSASPAALAWQAPAPVAGIGVVPRVLATYYQAGLPNRVIVGDWLIEAPAIGLRQAFAYAPDASWAHQIVQLSDLDIQAPPGGGLASVGNVTLRLADTGHGQSLTALWEAAGTLGGVQVTIDFLLEGAPSRLRIFTGTIDTVTNHDGISEVLIVDDSIRKNLQLPLTILDHATYPNADSSVLTKAAPLVYGQGIHGGVLPLLLTEVATHTYLVAAHPVTIEGLLAIFEEDTSSYLLLPDADAFQVAQTSGQTLVHLRRAPQEMRFNPLTGSGAVLTLTSVSHADYALDGISSTIAQIGTTGLDSNLDGLGQLTLTLPAVSAQRGNNAVTVDFINHRRALGSDPTVTGTFFVLTVDAMTGQVLRDNLFQSQAFRHSLHPQTTSFTVASLNLGPSEQVTTRVVARNEGGPGTVSNYYELGELAIQTYHQPTGDNEVFLTGTGWQGRTDPDGRVTAYHGGGAGTLLTTPDQVLASLLVQELGVPIDAAWAGPSYVYYTSLGYRFDGGLGAGWPIERADARSILDGAARQGMALLVPTFAAQWGIRPFRADTPIHSRFDASTILCTSGAETQLPAFRSSSVAVTLGNMAMVYHRFEVHFAYNVGSHKYDKSWIVDHNGSNVPPSVYDTTPLFVACLASFATYGQLEPLVLEANWIDDDVTAARLLNHLVRYFSFQRVQVVFDTTLLAAGLEVGDFITVTYPALPPSEQGSTFEVHGLRYQPQEGRMTITASRAVTLHFDYWRLKDQTGVVWYWWFDTAGQLTRDTLPPTADPLTAQDLGIEAPYWLRVQDETGRRWVLYPNTQGELLMAGTLPPIGSGQDVGLGVEARGVNQRDYRLGARSWQEWTVEELS